MIPVDPMTHKPLRSFTLRNFIEDSQWSLCRNGGDIAKLYASQLH